MKKISKLLSRFILSLSLALPLVLGADLISDYPTNTIDHTQHIADSKKGKDKGRGRREGGGKHKRDRFDHQKRELIGIDKPKNSNDKYW